MVFICLFALFLLVGYLTFRYVSLLFAFHEMIREIEEIKEDITQNQIIHLSIPNKHLAKVVDSFNGTLTIIRRERQSYDKREKEFQKQIENISHDLRTPLTVLLGYLKLLKNKKISGNELEIRETLGIIQRKGETLETLIAQFYDFSRLNGGEYGLTVTKVDISRILRESFLENYQLLNQKGLKVDFDLPGFPVWGVGEETGLERIFFNLLQNVERYAHSFLQISIREGAEYHSILFINDTTLVKEDDISQLFQRFYMQDHSRNQGGTGLGLTVAKLLAEEMEGMLEATIINEEEMKRTICFELKLKCI